MWCQEMAVWGCFPHYMALANSLQMRIYFESFYILFPMDFNFSCIYAHSLHFVLLSVQKTVFVPNQLPIFFLIGYNISGFMIMSLMHRGLSSAQDKYGSILILLHATIQFDMHHFLKMPSFPSVCFWLLSKRSGLYSWVFNSCFGANTILFLSLFIF